MNRNNQVVDQLQNELDEIRKDYVALKFNYQEEKNNSDQLRQRCHRLLQENADICVAKHLFQNRNEQLKAEVEQLQKDQAHLKPVPVTKKWNQLGSDRAKYKRKLKYKELVGDSLKYITECKRAKLTLTLGDEDVDLKWSEEEMRRQRQIIPTEENQAPRRPPSPRPDISDDNLEINENVPNEIPPGNDVFGTNFQFTQRHKRKIITVLDKHRVSHRAYHAIRKAANKNWPSLNIIKKEKRQMSQEIDFTTEAEVTFSCTPLITTNIPCI